MLVSKLLRIGNLPTTRILDLYSGAAVAYAFILLNSAYTGACVRIRRTSDSEEADFGFNNYELRLTSIASNSSSGGIFDGQSLSTFCAATTGVATIIYDQSGNGNNLIQTVASRQVDIFVAGALTTINTKTATGYFNASFDYYDLTTPVSSAGNLSAFHVQSRLAPATGGLFLGNSTTKAYTSNIFVDDYWYVRNRDGYTRSNSTDTFTGQVLASSIVISGGSRTMWKNGSALASSDTAVSGTLNYTQYGKVNPNGSGAAMQLFIAYLADKSSERSSIETLINNYYGIY